MKRTQAALLFSFMLISLCTKAQDELLKTNGRSYLIKNLQRNDSIIRFQKYPTGKRVYKVHLDFIYAIKYPDGQIVKNGGGFMSEEMFAYQKIVLYNTPKLRNSIAAIFFGSLFSAGGVASFTGSMLNLDARVGSFVQVYAPVGLFFGTIMSAGGVTLITVGIQKMRKAKANLRLAGPKPVTMNFNPVMIPAMNQSGVLTDFAAGAGMSIHF